MDQRVLLVRHGNEPAGDRLVSGLVWNVGRKPEEQHRLLHEHGAAPAHWLQGFPDKFSGRPA